MKRRDQKQRTPRTLKRLIHFPTGVWSWRCSGRMVKIRTPDHATTHKVDVATILGTTHDEIDRAQWKGAWWGGVTPDHVRRYITDTLLGGA